MDRGFLCNSNIEIEVDDEQIAKPQFVSVETLIEEDQTSMDITENALISEHEVEVVLDESPSPKNEIIDGVEETTIQTQVNDELDEIIQNDSLETAQIIEDGEKTRKIKPKESDLVKSPVETRAPAKGNIHRIPTNYKPILKKVSAPGKPVVLKRLLPPISPAITKAVIRTIMRPRTQATPTTSKAPSSSDIQIVDVRTVGENLLVPNQPKAYQNQKTTIIPTVMTLNLDPVIMFPNQIQNAQATPAISKAPSSPDVQIVDAVTNVGENLVAPNQQTVSLEVDTSRINPCIISGCEVYKNEEMYVFKVPEDTALLNIWDLCIDTKRAKPLAINDVICYKHFDESDVVHNFKTVLQNGVEVTSDEPHLRRGAAPCVQYRPECCIAACARTTGKMYAFPVLDEKNLRLWLYMAKDPRLRRLSVREFTRHRVCASHFEPDCFDEQGELTDRAVPTLHLPVDIDPKSFNVQTVTYFDVNATRCVFKNCENSEKLSKQANLFCLPCQDFSSLKMWLHASDRSDLIVHESLDATLDKITGLGICNKHFLWQDFENISMTKLKPDALPRNLEQRSESDGVKACAFNLCCNIVGKVKKIYAFPDDPERARAWLQVIKRDDLYVFLKNDKDKFNRYGVCEDHFVKSDFVNDELSPTAVPKNVIKFGENFTVCLAFPGQQQKNKNTLNEETRKTIKKMAFNRIRPVKILPDTCIYRGCKSKPSVENPFFSFPMEKAAHKTWLKACGYRNDWKVSVRYHLCGRHFDASAFDAAGRLTDAAVPASYKASKLVDPPEYVKSYAAMPPRPRRLENTTPKSSGNRRDDPELVTINVKSVGEIKREEDDAPAEDVDVEAAERVGAEDEVRVNEMELEMLCAVENCVTLSTGREAAAHAFPPPAEPERFEMWLRLVANEALDALTDDEIRQSYVVCARHFENFFYRGKELAKVAVPTLNLVTDSDWLKESLYYRNNVVPHMKNLQVDVPQVATSWLRFEPVKLSDQKDKTRCVLEKDRLRFPGMGCYLEIAHRNRSTIGKKFPYKVYKCSKTGFSTSCSEYGENFRVHTAIVIDDDDYSERTVMRYLSHKRSNAVSTLPENEPTIP